MFLQERHGLHGADAGEDVQELGMLGGGDWGRGYKEELVHFFLGGEGIVRGCKWIGEVGSWEG